MIPLEYVENYNGQLFISPVFEQGDVAEGMDLLFVNFAIQHTLTL